MICVSKYHEIKKKDAGAMTTAKNKVFTGLYHMKFIIVWGGCGN